MRCDVDGSPEKSVDCGNKFVEAKVAAVMEGVDVGADVMLPILRDAEIPLFGFVPYGPQQRSATDIAVFLGTAVPAYGAAELKNSADQGRKKLRLFLADLPSSHSYDESVLQPTAKALGLDVKIIFYDAASADWNALATTAMADQPDESGSPSAQEADCLGFIQGLRGAGFTGPIFAAGVQPVHRHGRRSGRRRADLLRVLAAVGPRRRAPAAQAELKQYTEQMTSVGQQGPDRRVRRVHLRRRGRTSRVAMQQYLDGEPTGKNILTALHAVKDMPGFLHGNLTCDGSVWKGETVSTGRRAGLRGDRRRRPQARLQRFHRRQRVRAEMSCADRRSTAGSAALGSGRWCPERDAMSQYVLFLFVGLGVGSIYAAVGDGPRRHLQGAPR